MTKPKLSFADWCCNNNRLDLLDRWDYGLNIDSPENVSYKTGKKVWFECPNNIHESEGKSLHYFDNDKQINIFCEKCESFAQAIINKYGEEYLNKVWSNENSFSPWDIRKNSGKEVVFNCEINKKHSYKMRCVNFYKLNRRCPYCSHNKVLREESLGALFPEIIDIWSEKNEKSPYEYSENSHAKVWFKCHNGVHEEYQRQINVAKRYNFACHDCVLYKNAEDTQRDMIGKKFNKLTVVDFDKEKKFTTNRVYVLCKCDCGNTEIKSYWAKLVKSGEIKSCGCLMNKNRPKEELFSWKGGISTESQLIRSSQEYKKWVLDVYKKDWYTCQCCGRKCNVGLLPNAHHIYPFSEYKDLRMDINNGITLCKECHHTIVKGSFHNMYGTHNNTPEQLEEYINNKRKQLGINIPFNIEEYQSGKILKPNDINDINNINNIDKYIDTRKMKKISELVMMKPISVIN